MATIYLHTKVGVFVGRVTAAHGLPMFAEDSERRIFASKLCYVYICNYYAF